MLLNIIKCGKTYLPLEDVPRHTYDAYSFETEKIIYYFLHSYFGIPEIKHDEDFLKSNFNPLLTKQSIFLVSQEACYEIPWLLIRHGGYMERISKLINAITDNRIRDVFTNLIKYSFTKDFYHLNKIIEKDTSLDISVFSLLNRAITINKNGFNEELLTEVIRKLYRGITNE